MEDLMLGLRLLELNPITGKVEEVTVSQEIHRNSNSIRRKNMCEEQIYMDATPEDISASYEVDFRL